MCIREQYKYNCLPEYKSLSSLDADIYRMCTHIEYKIYAPLRCCAEFSFFFVFLFFIIRILFLLHNSVLLFCAHCLSLWLL